MRHVSRVCALAVWMVAAGAGSAFAQEPGVDTEGCKDSTLVNRMPGCGLYECTVKEYDAADIVINMARETRTLEGAIEQLTYICPARMSPLQLQRNFEAALKKAGYKVLISGRTEAEEYPVVTVQKGAQWIEVRMSMFNEFPQYQQTAVLVKEMAQELTAGAQEIADALNSDGKLDVYGITFATGQATLTPASEQVLSDVLAVLTANADWKLRVEGHTDNVGNAAANQKLSQARAAAVVAWLTAKGIAADRVAAVGFGDTQPVEGNDTDEGRAKNRRVVLVKQ